MRILLVGPCHDGGSIPPYLDVLADGLTALGARVDRLGSAGLPYDPYARRFWPTDRILAAAGRLLSHIDANGYDLVSIHFGNLEIEQLLPALWAHRRRPPAVYHVHSLDWTLFTRHVPDPALRAAVDDGVAAIDGFVFFGRYAKQELTRRLTVAVPATVAWLPTTIPTGTRAATTMQLRAALRRQPGLQLATLYGYAAPWKDPCLVLTACAHARVPVRVVLAGPYWDEPDQAGVDLRAESAAVRRHGLGEVTVVPSYLSAGHRCALVQHSDLAVFPYRPHPTFQGSGAIADYLAHDVPVLATDVANMAELVGDAGAIIPPGDPTALAEAVDLIVRNDAFRARITRAARRRAPAFTAEAHARSCLAFYQHILDRKRVR
ncbi:MAG: glycosyltransferase [Streptosporangiales bacterium]|nr:glycosyltransferase [Streptosporangiales bacterium]